MKTIALLAALLLPAFASAQSFTKTYIERVDSAEQYIKAERWADAERNLKGALRLEPANPGNALLLSNLGYAQMMLSRPEEAIESYSVSLAIAPKSVVVLTNRGMAYRQSGRPEEAIADFDAALAVDSAYMPALKWRGMTFLARKETKPARRDLEAYSSAFPDDADVLEGLGQCALLDSDLRKGMEYLTRALGKEPTASRYVVLASLQLDSSSLPEAAETLRKGIDAFPREPFLYLLRARLHQLNYRPDDADIDRKTAIDLGVDPTVADSILR